MPNKRRARRTVLDEVRVSPGHMAMGRGGRVEEGGYVDASLPVADPSDDTGGEIDFGDAVEVVDFGDAVETEETPKVESVQVRQRPNEEAAADQRSAGRHEFAQGADRVRRYGGMPGPSMDSVLSFFEQAVERPQDALTGLYQGFTSNFGDELAGAAGGYPAFDANPLYGAMRSPQEMAEQAGIAEGEVDEATMDAMAESPELYAVSNAAGATAQGLALPLPTGAAWTGARGALGRVGLGAGIGAASSGLAAAGAAEDGGRLDAALDAAPEGALWGGGAAGGLEALGALGRAPGALRGTSETLGRHADRERLAASGIRSRQALAEADQQFMPPRAPGAPASPPEAGRRRLAQILRERNIGQFMGIPNPRSTVDDAVALTMEVGPQIGNPLRGPRHLGAAETELDNLGAFVDVDRIADDIQRSVAHESTMPLGSAAPAVREQLVNPLRGSGPMRFSRGHMLRQMFQRRQFPGVPEEYLQEAADIVNRHLDEAARATHTRQLDAAGAVVDMNAVADEVANQMVADGAPPAMIAQFTSSVRRLGQVPASASPFIRRDLDAAMAGRPVTPRGQAAAPSPPAAAPSPAAEPAGPRTVPRGRRARAHEPPPAAPNPHEAGTRQMPRGPAAPAAPVDEYARTGPQVMMDAPMDAPMAPPPVAPPAVAAPPLPNEPRVPVPSQYVSLVERLARERAARAGVQAQEALLAQRAREAAEMGGTPTPPPGMAWGDLNSDYALGRFLQRHVNADQMGQSGGPQGSLARQAAVRQMMGGSPMGVLEQELLNRVTPTITEGVRGGYARGLEFASSRAGRLGDFLERQLERPEMLGRFADGMRDAARGGAQGLAAYHYQQYMRDPEYRQLMDDNGIQDFDDDTGADPEIYDILSQGLTLEDMQ